MSNCKQRTLDEAKYILLYRSTLRETAKVFGVSKSTVHNDMQVRLQKIDYNIYRKVCKLLKYNFSIKHKRGGEVIRLRSLSLKK